MKTAITMRKYRFTDAQLIILLEDKLDFATRDAIEFADRGYDAARLAAMRQARLDFLAMPSDKALDAQKQVATFHKKQRRDELENATRRVKMAAWYALGTRSEYCAFGEQGIARLKDAQLLFHAEDVLKAARTYLSDLSSEGITAAKLDDYQTIIENFRLAHREQRIATINRYYSTGLRIKKANELYDFLTQICAIGKDIWYAESGTKYNHYVLYKTSKRTPKSASSTSPTPDNITVSTLADIEPVAPAAMPTALATAPPSVITPPQMLQNEMVWASVTPPRFDWAALPHYKTETRLE